MHRSSCDNSLLTTSARYTQEQRMNAGPATLADPGVAHRPFDLVVSASGCPASCMHLASSAQRPHGAATDSTRMAALRSTSGPALVKRVKNLRTIKEKERTHSSPASIYSGPGGLRQDPGRAA